MSFQNFKENHDAHIIQTYARQPVAFVKGQGCKLWDMDGKEYIDFASGIGVLSVGHSHPVWVEAVTEQAGKLTHVCNLFYTEPGAKLAKKLCEISGLSAVFFANSGAESNEGLIKLARKYSKDKYGDGRSTIITLNGSFHGRTMAALTATAQAHFHKHFDPFMPGFRYVPPNDIDALANQGDDVCAVLLEPIQGEGGVIPLDKEYIKQVAKLCEERDWLLMIDEVQTGIGRLGYWFGFQELGVKPDAISFAKGVGGGIPLGGFIVSEKLRNVLGHGTHGTTYGGNPLCAAAGLATIEILESVLPQVAEKGEYMRTKIKEMNLPKVLEVRGKGLMIGIKIDGIPPAEINGKLLQAGLVGLTAGADALRFLPPLIISMEDIDAGLAIFEKVMKTL